MVNATIGAGILGLPSRVFALSGPYSVIAFLLCALLIGLVILCFAEVSSRFEGTGGPYLYAREAVGPVFAFQIGWLMWFQRVTAFAAVCNLLVSYLAFLWPGAGSGVLRALVITTVSVSLAVVNVRGVRHTAVLGNVLTVGKLAPLLLFILVGLVHVDPHRWSVTSSPSLGGLASSILLLVFAYSGFDAVVVAAGEMHEPRRNLPFAMFMALGVVSIIYMSIQVVCIGTLPELAASERPLADAASRFMGPFGGLMIVAGAVISTTGTLMATMLAAPRILYALADHRELPRALASTHPQFHTPHVAVLVSSAVMLAVTLGGSFIHAVTVNVMIRLIIYLATCIALVVLRRKPGAPPAMYTVPGGGIVVAGTTMLCLWVLTKVTWQEARDVGI